MQDVQDKNYTSHPSAETKEIESWKKSLKFFVDHPNILDMYNWPSYGEHNLPVYSLYNYYPARINTRDREILKIRHLVWDFKAAPKNPAPIDEIVKKHQHAVEKVVPLLSELLSHTFGNLLSHFCLCCITASNKEVDERRFKDFSEKLCHVTGMENGFPYRKIIKDGTPKHCGGIKTSEIWFDPNFFKKKHIILFDDVVTRGDSMIKWRDRFLALSPTNNVICGITIGRTEHNL